MTLDQTPESFVFMKVGDHAGESFDAIIKRKRQEAQAAGRIFWGYGGSACHPLTQVQPFVKTRLKKQGAVYLLMEPVHSTAEPDVVPATEFSNDGVNWQPIPEGIEVTGSRYALVLSEIIPGDLEIDPDDYEVGIGPSRGRRASRYIRGRTDKACLIRGQSDKSGIVDKGHHITYVAPLAEPYAVLLR